MRAMGWGMFIVKNSTDRTLDLDRLGRCASLCMDPYPWQRPALQPYRRPVGAKTIPQCHNRTGDPTSKPMEGNRVVQMSVLTSTSLPPYLLQHKERFASYFHYVRGHAGHLEPGRSTPST